MRTRRQFLLLLTVASALMTAAFLPVTAQDLTKQEQEVVAMDIAELRQLLTEGFRQYETQLQAVLRTRFPEEQQFVGSIVYLVQTEKIPKNIVDSAWLWVRKNRPTTNYPFVYFERVLRLEAEKLKLEIPEFDRELYNKAIQTRGFQSGFFK